jgi:hypothetical protein
MLSPLVGGAVKYLPDHAEMTITVRLGYRDPLPDETIVSPEEVLAVATAVRHLTSLQMPRPTRYEAAA